VNIRTPATTIPVESNDRTPAPVVDEDEDEDEADVWVPVEVEFVAVLVPEVLVGPVEFVSSGPVPLGITGPGACVIPVGRMTVAPVVVTIEGIVSRLPESSVVLVVKIKQS
jgi:hypothetical protein